MKRSLNRIFRVALAEWRMAIVSRRALVTLCLFAVTGAVMMYFTISAFASIEAQVVETLGLPAAETTGAVTLTLWKAPVFAKGIETMIGNSLVYQDIQGRHPLVLAYAFFLFEVVSLLTLMVSSSSVANDVRSGAVRYYLTRVTRTEWSLGKFIGEALLIASAMLLGTLIAGGIIAYRLSVNDALALFPELLDWSVRAWIYAFAWLGVFMGISHLTTSGGKAMALSFLALFGLSVLPTFVSGLLVGFFDLPSYLTVFEYFAPRALATNLWRHSPSAVFLVVVQLVSLAFFYLSLGACYFKRRDI